MFVSNYVCCDFENVVIKEWLKNLVDEFEFVIVKDMMFIGFDVFLLYILYLDCLFKGV